jgi:ElaA protein
MTVDLRSAGGGMASGQNACLEWRDFADFSAELLYEMLRFRQAIFVVEQASPYPDLDGLDRRAHHLLLHIDGILAGYLRVIPDPGAAQVAIGRVAIAAPWRRQGLARRIMAEALARCRRDYPDCRVVLGAQRYLAPFYESLGFRAVGPPYDDYGVAHIDMAREPGCRRKRRSDA